MEAELQSHVAFHLTGKRLSGDLETLDDNVLAPALLARYRDLTELRYDYPVILAAQHDRPAIQALSAVIDDVLEELAQGDDGERISRHAFRVEAALRRVLARGARGTLSQLWEKAVAELGATGDDLLSDSLARLRAAIKVDGELVDCDASLAGRVFALEAARVYERKAVRFRADVERLIHRLTDLLRADFAHSSLGRSAPSLRAALAGLHEDAFDFEVMSTLLMEAVPESSMLPARRTRINGVLHVLCNQRFYPMTGGPEAYGFTFTSPQQTLAAYRERLPALTELARAIEIAELEIAGEYREARHDAYFAEFDERDVDPEDLALFPDYCVVVSAQSLRGAEGASLIEMLSGALPVKALVQTEDVLEEGHPGEGHIGFGARARQLVHMAVGANDVHVLQASAASLYQCRERLTRAMEYRGAALVSIYVPGGVTTPGLSPYLVAAAATESRIFPTFVFDPSAGSDWASRCDVSANPQAEQDWPTHRFEYEGADHQRVTVDLAFTAIDFIACDIRFTRHFARVPKQRWSDALVTVADALQRAPQRLPGVLPCTLVVDDDMRLQKVLVDERLMREARRCRELWHSLQELGGVHNSHAERVLARERARRKEEQEETAAVAAPSAAPAAVAATVPTDEPAPAESASSDTAYIETPRCTSCNECINLNDKMFGYDQNKQARIVDLEAGTYAQLVEAAENCQVAIIHPGKPRQANEPGIEALLERAKPFL